MVLLQNPSGANFNPTKSPSAEIKSPYRRKGFLTDLKASKRCRFDFKNRGGCSRTQWIDLTHCPCDSGFNRAMNKQRSGLGIIRESQRPPERGSISVRDYR